MNSFSRESCLALVEQSPVAVAAHDKDAWLSIFASNALVEDPVGSAPQRQGEGASRAGALGRFYETFIAPNVIHFEVARDIVCAGHVMRDLTIVITMSPRVTVRVPVHLLYELVEEQGELRIARLAAHWELGPMLKQQLASGTAFLSVGTKSFVRMARHMGLSGIAGFSRASNTVGEKGKNVLYDFTNTLAQRDSAGMSSLFASPEASVEFPRGASPLPVAECAQRGGNMRLDKVLASGNTVTATVDYQAPDAVHRGVILAVLDPKRLKIERLTCYWER